MLRRLLDTVSAYGIVRSFLVSNPTSSPTTVCRAEKDLPLAAGLPYDRQECSRVEYKLDRRRPSHRSALVGAGHGTGSRAAATIRDENGTKRAPLSGVHKPYQRTHNLVHRYDPCRAYRDRFRAIVTVVVPSVRLTIMLGGPRHFSVLESATVREITLRKLEFCILGAP